jgi:hypothetical protein
VKAGTDDIFKPTIWNERSHEIRNDNGVKVVNFTTSKNSAVKSTMFSHQTFINIPGPLLMERHTTRLITFPEIRDSIQVCLMSHFS